MENEDLNPSPEAQSPTPPSLEEHDGSAELMAAIGRHAEAAKALAEIAAGADPGEVLAAWLAEIRAPEAPPQPNQPNQPNQPPQPAIYQSSNQVDNSVDDSWPACLGTPSSGFWDNLQFI